MAELVEDHADLLLDHSGLNGSKNALNLSELQRRRFLSHCTDRRADEPWIPRIKQSTGQLQISASLLFDVFSRHEPKNRLLQQAQREVLDDQLELSRLKQPSGC